MDFTLPLLPADTPLDEAFSTMIIGKCSGVVIQNGAEFQVLHYAELLSAWEAGLETLASVKPPTHRTYTESVVSQSRTPNLEVLSAAGAEATLRSLSELIGDLFKMAAPGFVCTGPRHHGYPPHIAGTGNRCVVALCPGTI